jgi:Spy/CpxP family protein refolding chaperone
MRAFILALSMVVASSSVVAQSESASPGIARVAKLQQMKNNLGLTDEQVNQMREIRQAGGTREDVRAVLSPEQQAKAVKLRQSQKGKDMKRKGRLQHLDLGDEQVAKIQSIRQSGGSREEIRAVLTPEQRAELDASHDRRPSAGASPEH